MFLHLGINGLFHIYASSTAITATVTAGGIIGGLGAMAVLSDKNNTVNVSNTDDYIVDFYESLKKIEAESSIKHNEYIIQYDMYK